MEEIRRQVAAARRRLVVQQFLGILPWALLIALLIAVIGLAIPKIWIINIESNVWFAGWMGGAFAAGLLVAIGWTLAIRRQALDAAIELDRRFGLKERVSSVLSLPSDELETEAGQALLKDAARRVESLEVREKFGISISSRALLPILPALVALALVLVPDAQDKLKAASSDDAAVREQIKRSTQDLKTRLAQKQKRVEESGLKDAEQIFKKLHQGLDEMSKDGNVDRKKALVKINDLAKELEQRRKALGDPDKMQKQFEGLKNIERGPAEKIASAMKEGNFEKAIEQLKQLQDKMEQGDLSEQEKEQLAQQLQQMQQKMQEMVDAQRDAKAELERQIQQKMADGDLEGAGKLQRKLDELQQQDRQMQQLEQMANKLGQAAEAMQSGDMESAQSQLSEFSDQLQEMQSEMQQLASLDEVMDEIADAKNAMNCEQCGGAGCESCQGSGQFGQSGMGSDQFGFGDGMGEGQGAGYRPEQETDTGVYESKVRGDPRAGEAVRVGDAIGPNKAGQSQESVKQEILSALRNDSDPLSDQRLPKDQQEHVREYYKRFEE
ncbi:MAG: hypothetical protein WD070_12880 [Pirellulaceae bacterium]